MIFSIAFLIQILLPEVRHGEESSKRLSCISFNKIGNDISKSFSWICENYFLIHIPLCVKQTFGHNSSRNFFLRKEIYIQREELCELIFTTLLLVLQNKMHIKFASVNDSLCSFRFPVFLRINRKCISNASSVNARMHLLRNDLRKFRNISLKMFRLFHT